MDENRITYTTPEQRQRERFERKSNTLAENMLRRVLALSRCPDSLTPFCDTLRRVYVELEDVRHPEGVSTVGTYCVMVPPELIYAHGAMPVKLCSGSYTAFSIGDDNAPRDACPLVKAVMGAETVGALPVYENCSFMAVPVTCDCKKKLAGWLSQRRPVSTLYVPANRERDESLEQFTAQLYALSDELAAVTGLPLRYENLEIGCQVMADAQRELSRFIAIRREHPTIIRGSFAMAVMNAMSYTWAPLWTKQLAALNGELEERARRGEMAVRDNQPRILLTGSPVVFPNFKIPLLIEEMGGLLAADETCMGERGLYDPPAVIDRSVDGIMRALANRATRPCTCPSFADNRRRIYRVRQLIEDYKIQGVVYHVLRGCLVYDYEYRRMEEELEKLGVPIIRLETDYNEEDVEQLRIRVEAFLELIKFGGGKA